MADNAQKTPVGTSLNRFARATAQTAIQKLGKSLPATVVKVMGSIVQVNFEVQSGFTLTNVTIPLIGCEYARPPIQVGCKGFVLAADAYLGGMSGLGGGTADLRTQFNLTALVFAPIGNTGWTTVDPNAYVIYGPNGVVLRDTSNAANLTLLPTSITLSCGGHSLIINSTGVIIDGKVFLTHEHTNVQNGSGTSGGVA